MTLGQLSGTGRVRRAFGASGLLAAALLLSACQSDGTPFAMAGSSGSAVAFDQIDGPPQATFDKLVSNLATAADTRKVAVVSRQETAPYRVKGYLAVQQDGGKASVAYAWDVYDKDLTRVARVTGSEPLGTVKRSSDPWTLCNDQVLAKIADRTMADLSATVNGGASAPVAIAAAPQPADPAPAAAASEAEPTHTAAFAPPAAGEASSPLAYAAR